MAHHPKSPISLPRIDTRLSRAEILTRLEQASRRGKVPGWTSKVHASGLFAVADFGRPFESNMVAEIESENPDRTTLCFKLHAKPVMPMIFLLVLVLSVWPGVWLTDSMLRSYFTGYDYKTWMWYMPLTVPFVPWGMWSAWKKSRASAFSEAFDILDKISTIIDGRIVDASARNS